MAMFHLRATWTGVAGSPAYFNAYATMASGATAQDFVDGVEDLLTAWDARQHNSVSWTTDAEVTEIDPITKAAVDSFAVTARVGTGSVSDALLPTSTQALVRLNTDTFINGRRVQGRWNVPYLTEAANDTGGVPVALLRTDFNTAFGVYLSSSNYFPLVSIEAAPGYAGITSGVAQPKWAVLRSRRD